MLVEMLDSLGVKDINLSKYSQSFHRDSETLYLNDQQAKELSDRISKLRQTKPHLNFKGDALSFVPLAEVNSNTRADQITYTSENEQRLALHKFLSRSGCSAGRSSLGIGPNGKGILCEQMEMSSRFQFGDLTNQTILEVWNSDELKKFTFPEKEQFKGKACEHCSSFNQCATNKGQCFRDNYFYFNNLYEVMKDCPHRATLAI
ncbi:MAG: SPASM domain-containing protein [Oligoflexia bacterium]|nr:SPASM domain-containing protein [Oligoflexia bacterium]